MSEAVLERILATGRPLLTDGGIETELMSGTDYAMDYSLQVGALVLDPEGLRLIRRVVPIKFSGEFADDSL